MLVTPQNVADVIAAIKDLTLLAVDCETTGLEETDQAFAVIIATATEEYYFDVRQLNFVGYLQPIFLNKNLTLIFQNAKFDLRMMASIGLTVDARCVDISSMARLYRNDHFDGGYSLSAQATRELGRKKTDDVIKNILRVDKLYEMRKDAFGAEYKVPRYDRVDISIMQSYACNDARLTYDLYEYYLKRLDDNSIKVFKLESDLIKVCYRMERLGLMLNKQHTIKAMHHEMGLVNKAKQEYMKLTTCAFVNSAKSIQKHLEYELPLTEDGNPSLTDDVIESIITNGSHKDKEIAETVRLIRMYDKRVTTYYKPYINLVDRQGLIHPTMWIAGTRTGRFSYSNPNFQNIPKEEPTDYHIRECFMPRDGRTYVSFDFSQMEYRMSTAYAGQMDIIEKVMSGTDFHQATADMTGITRKQAKTLNFAVLYGAGTDKIAGMLGVSKHEATMLKTRFFMALPKVEQFIDSVIATGRSRGYVTNWYGRRLYADKEFCYALPNHLIQGGGADVVKLAMYRIAKEFPTMLMVLQVHDQLVFELTEEEMQHVPRIKEIMETVFPEKNGMRLQVDISISKKSLAEKDMVKYDGR